MITSLEFRKGYFKALLDVRNKLFPTIGESPYSPSQHYKICTAIIDLLLRDRDCLDWFMKGRIEFKEKYPGIWLHETKNKGKKSYVAVFKKHEDKK